MSCRRLIGKIFKTTVDNKVATPLKSSGRLKQETDKEQKFKFVQVSVDCPKSKFETAIGVYRFVGGFRSAYKFLLNQLVKVKRERLDEIFDVNETKEVFDYDLAEVEGN